MLSRLLWPWQARARLVITERVVRLTFAYRIGTKRSAPLEFNREVVAQDVWAALGGVFREARERSVSKVGIDVVIGSSLTHLFVVEPPAGARRTDDLRAAAALRFESLIGTSSDTWRFDADWRSNQPFLAAAISENTLAGIRTAIADTPFRILSVVPQLIDALNREARGSVGRDGWVVGIGVENTCSVVLGQGRVRHYRESRAESATWRDDLDLQHWIDREALVLGVDRPGALLLLDFSLHGPAFVREWNLGATQVRASVASALAPHVQPKASKETTAEEASA